MLTNKLNKLNPGEGHMKFLLIKATSTGSRLQLVQNKAWTSPSQPALCRSVG